ncbi:MAG: hypothetical protein RLZZ490_887 [Cyanobacteriota bacterium]
MTNIGILGLVVGILVQRRGRQRVVAKGKNTCLTLNGDYPVGMGKTEDGSEKANFLHKTCALFFDYHVIQKLDCKLMITVDYSGYS